MRLLLDTHVLLWALSTPEALVPEARRVIEDGANEVLVSAASFWEIAIKATAGRLTASDDLLAASAEAGFSGLTIDPADAVRAGALPPLHRDPFDRMLVAQAQARSLAIVTRDTRLAAYGVTILPA
ncbi:MAG: type II toxin-antitoxin system VapC family toxin [Chloroflexota bacterium]